MTQSFVETPEQVQSALMHGTRQFQRQRRGTRDCGRFALCARRSFGGGFGLRNDRFKPRVPRKGMRDRNIPKPLPKRNAPLAAAASHRSLMRKQSVFDRRLRIGNCAIMATASNAPFASAIFRKRCDLFEAWVIWLKPKVITPISASAGAT